jgi:hypothetical protein
MENNDHEPGSISFVAAQIVDMLDREDGLDKEARVRSVRRLLNQTVQNQTQKERLLSEMLLSILARIKDLATPPARTEISDPSQLPGLIGERIDKILQITSEAFVEWSRLQQLK